MVLIFSQSRQNVKLTLCGGFRWVSNTTFWHRILEVKMCINCVRGPPITSTFTFTPLGGLPACRPALSRSRVGPPRPRGSSRPPRDRARRRRWPG